MPYPIAENAAYVDFTGRITQTNSVVASPSAAAETIIAQLTVPNLTPIISGVILFGWAAYTVGTNGVSVQLRIRQTNVTGTIVGNSGALTGSQHGAAILSADDVGGFDAAPPSGGVYCLTMQVASGSAASTVSSVQFVAIQT